MKNTHLIKRYQNRKLYDTIQGKYVTLEEIGILIKLGENIQVINDRSKEDITCKTLATVLCHQIMTKNELSIEQLQRAIVDGISKYIKLEE
ncbi:MAG TPA: polyhydroxyalkanoate synthesis regulator DNA-binding domain-containing protein [Patescibacteria group bacterium]|nr:polyhydroxyalkanoate synthesis regulator DNA-binding domain-containing protein [Patescibacteria group bacterium]